METETTSSLIQLTLTFLFVINPLGNAPLILALLKNFDWQQQRRILLRESLFAFCIAILFQFFGEYLLTLLHIDPPALPFCGGIILFLLALKMIFPTPTEMKQAELNREPFIVPIAMPLLTGPGTLSVIMLTAAEEPDFLKVTIAISLACFGMIAINMLAPYLQKLIGQTGMAVLEQITGLILVLMSVEMLLKGTTLFISRL